MRHSSNFSPSFFFHAATLASVFFSFVGCERSPAPHVPESPKDTPSPIVALEPSPLEPSPRVRWNRLKAEGLQGVRLDEQLQAKIAAHVEPLRAGNAELLTGKEKLSATVLDSLVRINAKYQRSLMALKNAALPVLRNRNVSDQEKFVTVVDDDVTALLSDNSYLAALRKNLGEKEIDCKEISTTLLLAMLLRFQQTNLSSTTVNLKLVSGLCFDENYAPGGIGHSWVEFDGQVYDWAIKSEGKMTIAPASSSDYVPIVWSIMTYHPHAMRATSEVWLLCAPE